MPQRMLMPQHNIMCCGIITIRVCLSIRGIGNLESCLIVGSGRDCHTPYHAYARPRARALSVALSSPLEITLGGSSGHVTSATAASPGPGCRQGGNSVCNRLYLRALPRHVCVCMHACTHASQRMQARGEGPCLSTLPSHSVRASDRGERHDPNDNASGIIPTNAYSQRDVYTYAAPPRAHIHLHADS